MSKVKISINSAQSSVKINDQEINDVITDLTVNVRPMTVPTVTLTLAPMDLEINGETFHCITKEKIITTHEDKFTIEERIKQ